jgi:pantoate--beta-alanine ligase
VNTYIARNFKSLKIQLEKKNLIRKKIGLIPTMGSLHEGHLALIKKSKDLNCFTIVTIFLNPIQFNSKTDLIKYPIQEKEDIKLLKNNKVDLIYIPKLKDIYPKNYSTYLSENLYSNLLCGNKRKNHFSGVTTIVLKLFLLINPKVAFFGEKDFQQLVIIKKIIQDLNLNIKVVSVNTVRDQSGLALSSRNKLLSSKQLDIARKINYNLKKVNLYNGKDVTHLKNFLKKEMKKDGIINIEYLEVRSESELKKLKEYKNKDTRVFIAVNIGKVRLIDNFRWEKC